MHSHARGTGDSDRAIAESPAGSLVALVWRLPLAAMLAALTSLIAQSAVDHIDFSAHHSNAAGALASISCAVLAAALLVLALVPGRSRWWTASALSGLSALASLALAFPLSGTKFYLFGLSGDQFFRVQYLSRLTESWHLADGNYADLPPYYPAGWFWLGGRFANLLGLSGWAAYKPWAIMTMAVAAAVAFVLWNVVVPRSAALLLALLTCLECLRMGSYEPYSAILIASIAPVTAIVWQGSPLDTRNSRAGWGTAVFGGSFIGICGAVYTLYGGFFALMMIVRGGSALVSRTNARTVHKGVARGEAGRAVAWLGVACAVAVPIALLSWAPYLLRRAHTESAGNPAARFLPESSALLPTPMTEFTVTGALSVAGLFWILWQWQGNRIARALGTLVLMCYAWYFMSTLLLAAKTTLLAFRLEPVVVIALVCAGGLGAWHLIHWISQRAPAHRKQASRAAFAVGLICAVSLVQTMPSALQRAVNPSVFDRAHTTHDDTGRRPDGQHDAAEPGAWNGELISTIAALTHRPAQDLVVLTSDYPLLALRPYRGFQTSMLVYANPLAQYDRRRELIESWARQPDATALLSALDRSPFAPPSVFVLSRADKGLNVSVSRDMFPRSAAFHEVSYPEKLFEHPAFERRDVGPFTVIVRRT